MRLQVTNGFDASYNLARQSKDIPLTEEALSELTNTTAVVCYEHDCCTNSRRRKCSVWLAVTLLTLPDACRSPFSKAVHAIPQRIFCWAFSLCPCEH